MEKVASKHPSSFSGFSFLFSFLSLSGSVPKCSGLPCCLRSTYTVVARIIRTIVFSPAKNEFKSVISSYFLAGENTSVLIILATTVHLHSKVLSNST